MKKLAIVSKALVIGSAMTITIAVLTKKYFDSLNE